MGQQRAVWEQQILGLKSCDEDGGGHQRAVWEQQRLYWFHLLGSLKNLTTGLIWLVTRGGWGDQGGRARGGDGGARGEGSGEQKPYGWVGGPGLEKGEGRVWGHQDTRDVGAERQIKKKVQMRGNGEGAKGTCWAPAPGVGGALPCVPASLALTSIQTVARHASCLAGSEEPGVGRLGCVWFWGVLLNVPLKSG